MNSKEMILINKIRTLESEISLYKEWVRALNEEVQDLLRDYEDRVRASQDTSYEVSRLEHYRKLIRIYTDKIIDNRIKLDAYKNRLSLVSNR